jgi:peptide-methionine (S)-S-oxide reductase
MKKLALLSSLMLVCFSGAARADTAVFAGGCFWCMEAEFSHKEGVTDVVSGFAGEGTEAPSYNDVGTGETGFKEAVKVTYDPKIVTYAQLLDIFWSNVDPFDAQGQFCDKGTQYQAAIYFSTKEEDVLARSSLKKVEEKFKKEVATQILPNANFYAAEDYHQDFYEKNKEHYERYKKGCRRVQTLEDIWGEDDKEQ